MTSPFDALPDGVLRLDRDRRIVDANAAAADLTGFDRDDMVGASIGELLDPRTKAGKPLLVDGWDRSAGLATVHRIPEQDILIRRRDGHDVRLLVTGRYDRNGDGQVSGAVLVLRDAGHRAHLIAQGIEIVSTVSHELRSPLTSVKGYTSLLLNRWDRLSDEQKQMMLGQVHHDADRVTRLVSELLDISRLETGRLVLRRELVNLAVLAHEVITKVKLQYPDLDCAVEFPTDFPRVYADPDKVEQVLTNLVENAAKYASPTGMFVSGVIDDPDVRVSVADQGEGIPPSDLPRVFNKFFRRAEGRPTGSGLGLWISRGLVEAHGGRLTATSNPGQGSTFSFTLPLRAFEELHGELTAAD